MPSLAAMQQPPQPVPDSVQLPPTGFPEVPGDVIERFPDMQDWQDSVSLWYNQLVSGLDDWTNTSSSTTTTVYQGQQNLSVQQGILSAQIVTLTNTVISGNAALASQIITISALASSASHISAQSTPPVGPSVNDIWVDTANIAAPITYFWNGAAWQLQTTPVIATAISSEALARATADGNLAGKYTLTVAAGNVVTGMNITSSTGGGTNISQVIFNATDFLIYNGVSGQPMFAVSGGLVTLGQTFVVDYTNQKVYIGVGTYNNSNTAFYLDSNGKFSLGSGLHFDGTNLSISGSISSSSGAIGGFAIGATTLSAGSGFQHVLLDSATPWIALGTVTGGVLPFAGMFGSLTTTPVVGVGLGGNFLGLIGLDATDTYSILQLTTSGTTAKISLSSAGIIQLFSPAFNQSTIIAGSNPQPSLAQYLLAIENLTNTTDQYGLFIGTNWKAFENFLINVGNVDAVTAAYTPYFAVHGDGSVEFGTYTAGAPGATGFVTIVDTTGRSTKLLAA